MRFIFSILILVFLFTQPCSAASSSSSSQKSSTSAKTTTSSSKKKSTSAKATTSTSKKKNTSTETTTPSSNKYDPFPRAAASYLVKVDGRTVWSHNPDSKLPIASITKIMTALLVLENCQLDETATIGENVEKETGSRLFLRKGDQLKVGDLLAAALIRSACDACVALAEHVAGDQERFVAMMNKRAFELGLLNTHFQNAAGHDNNDNYSTANDIAVLTKKALSNPIFAELVSTDSKKITTVDGKRTFRLNNTNDMLGTFTGTKGVKTGFTSQAGKCLVSLAERKGTNVMLVLLNSPRRWKMADEIMEKAFSMKAVNVAAR
jgi:serine-type D-Ala-D-Ala carboxypeptidase (penicillin-binding protein 5/6)